jgi:hypothetical protein
LAGLNAVNFSTNPVDLQRAILSEYITDFGTRQFLMKVCGKSRDTSFRFNLSVLKKMDEIE